jgi:predicted alpha-1,2-mannosidase
MKLLKELATIIAILFSTEKTIAQDRQPVDYVNPYIGTGKSDHLTVWESKGATFPGVLAPYGMVQVTPDGYDYTDKMISSFSFLDHHSGWSSKGNFQLMVSTGAPDSATALTGSGFNHANEKTTPFYYSVLLDDYHVKAEYTATSRVGYMRFTFPESSSSKISLSGISDTRVIDSVTIAGRSRGYYYVAKFSKPFRSCRIAANGRVALNYSTTNGACIDVKIAFSTASGEGAVRNLQAEAPEWNFPELTQSNRKVWNDKLGQIEVKGGTENQKSVFYTALYHSFFMPSIQSDAGAAKSSYTGMYPWDTYRSKHPLFTIIDPVRQGEMISSELDEYDRTGWLPTGNMMGNHNIGIITDCYVKGIRNFDAGKAMEAMRKSVLVPPYARREMADFNSNGYVPAEITSSVTHTLEFAYNDWALAEFISVTGNKTAYKDDYDTLLRRAGYYANLYDPGSGFMKAKSKDGQWSDAGYCEGTEWTYSWYAPHDIKGLVNLMGGIKKFTTRLTECFEKGYYVHDNEPPLHYAYLFNYCSEPWQSQKWARKIVTENYTNTPGGIPGNDDLGALSSWYVLSAMGFYPVSPGKPVYEIGSPLFDEVIIHLSNGKNFRIKTTNNSAKNIYIQSAFIDANPLNRPWISHDDIINGRTIVFNMGALPNKKWGSNPAAAPPSMTSGSPEFTFSELTLSTTKTRPDEPFNISVLIHNKGNSAGTAELSIRTDGKLLKNEYAILQAGETRRVTCPTRLYRSGGHYITVNSNKPQRIQVEPTAPTFTYNKLEMPQPALVMANDSIAVSAIVKNTGSTAGFAATKFYINNKEISQQRLALQPGEEKRVAFTFKQADDGVYTAGIGSLEPMKVRVLNPQKQRIANIHLQAYGKAAVALSFDDGPADTVKDLSGLGNHAIVKGKVKWVDGLFGKAIQADASQEAYLEIPGTPYLNKLSNGKTLTMMCWVYPMDEENFADVFAKGNLNTLQVKGGNTVINYYTGGWEGHESSATVPGNWNRHWHHLAGVTAGGYLKLYVDGNLVATKKEEPKNPKGETAGQTYTEPPWNIGRNAQSTERVFKGFIDDILLFETALSQEEIYDIMMHVK